MDREFPKSSTIKEFPAANIPSPGVGTQSMITVWKTVCEQFRNWSLAWEGMKLDSARKKSVRRQKHSVTRGVVQAEVGRVGERTGGKGDVAAEAGAEGSHCLPQGKICNDRAEKMGETRVGVKAVLNDGQDLVLIPLRRVLVVVCTV